MLSHPRFTDRRMLRDHTYADHHALETRRSIYRYRQPRLDLVDEVMSRLTDVPAGTAVDVGCGSGVYTRELRRRRPGQLVVGLDLSTGMVTTTGGPGAVADAERLPLPDNSCVIGLALHMLYHVPDPGTAVAELARVCRPDGTVVLAGNAEDDKIEFNAMWDAAVAEVPGVTERFRDGDFLSVARMAELAEHHFGSVTLIDFVGETVVPEAEPVLAWLESTRPMRGVDDATFEAIMDRAGNYVDRQIVHTGGFRLTNHIGVIVARP